MAEPTTDVQPRYSNKNGQARYDRRSKDEQYQKINTTLANLDAKNEELKIQKINKAISKAELAINNAYYGNKASNRGIKFPGKQDKINGVFPIILAINEIDFCNLVNYITNKLLTGNPESPSSIVRNITTMQSKAKEIINAIDLILLNSNTISTDNTKFKQAIIPLRDSIQEILAITTDPEITTAVPQVTQATNFITDYIRKLDRNITLDNIPITEVQDILKRVRDLRMILSLIVGINSLRDALGAVQSLTKLNIDKQITNLQNSLDISRILPIIRKVITLSNSINQYGQTALRYIKIVITITRIISAIIKIFKAIVRIYNKLFLPMKFTLFGMTSTMQSIKSKFELKIEVFQRRIGQVSTLIHTIYRFIGSLVVKLQNINTQLQILQSNLEACENTNESPILQEIIQTRNKIVNTISELDSFISKINQAQLNNEIVYGQYILKIEEEVLVDREIRYTRRRGIAFDVTGTAITQTDLTFATDNNIIIEELKLKLQTLGVTESAGASGTGYPDLDILLKDITTEEDNVEIDNNIIDQEYNDIQNELNIVIDGIKGSARLKRKVQEKVSKQTADIKTNVNNGVLPNTPINNIGINTLDRTTINTGSAQSNNDVNKLSNEQISILNTDLNRYIQLRSDFETQYNNVNRNGFRGDISNNPTWIKYTNKINNIRKKLELNNKSRLPID
jgi:hypothetical protein